MFGQLKQFDSRIPTIDTLYSHAITHITALSNREDLIESHASFRKFYRDRSWLESWGEEFKSRLKENLTGKTVAEQALNLRKMLLESSRGYISNNMYFNDDFTEEETEKIVKDIFKPNNMQEYFSKSYQLLIYADAEIWAIRSIAEKFYNDAKDNDFYYLYYELYRQYINNLYRHRLTTENNTDTLYNVLMTAIHPQLQELEFGILEGREYTFDKKEFEKSRADDSEE